ncbi:MAG TPA: hypothetical protein VFE82_01440 [Ramlibacter sp.]|jgi:hypothetical protein|uniref:hypothetical protein n=1 Tax=Ramlibacter sp. TaxID=1917967 RepID=UPI002D4F284F|nr:hypothetical protein [Ramlibacter sp.]HZY17110.1 hypothetical protein [Ramlibacter sp.]
MNARLLALAPALSVLAGCVAPPGPAPAGSRGPLAAPAAVAAVPDPAAGTTYHCDDGSVVVARFTSDTLQLAGLPQGPELLLRDAGGTRPGHTVWSSPGWRAEFGSGEDDAAATLHRLRPPGPELRCRRH